MRAEIIDHPRLRGSEIRCPCRIARRKPDDFRGQFLRCERTACLRIINLDVAKLEERSGIDPDGDRDSRASAIGLGRARRTVRIIADAQSRTANIECECSVVISKTPQRIEQGAEIRLRPPRQGLAIGGRLVAQSI